MFIRAWQLLERDDLGNWRHLQVTLRLLGRNDPALFSWNVIGWRERPKLYKLRQAAAGSQLSDHYDL